MPPQTEHKYTRHSKSQRNTILACAEELFIQRGVENVTMSNLAEAAGMTRATLYRYYDNKERVLWAIHNQQIEEFSKSYLPKLEQQDGTTYDRLSFFLHLLTGFYRENPASFRFLDVFFQTYQEATTEPGKKTYHMMHGDGFGSGDIVRILTKNFHDGSVKPDLDPVPTVVSLIYGTLGILLYLLKCTDSLAIKYNVSALYVLDTCVDALLAHIRPEPSE